MIRYLRARPYLSITLAFAALFDAIACVRFGHADWIVPALIAVSLGLLTSTTPEQGR